MPTEQPTRDRISFGRAVRHHLAVVLVFLALGSVAGWLYVDSIPTTYTSTTRVLVNPSVGNPYAPTPSSVRQDELTSLETEAQVARSTEVLEAVADGSPGLTVGQLEDGLQVAVPPNTQILEITYVANDPEVAQQNADAVAGAYLDNRARRFEEVNSARIDRIETQTLSVVTDLRAATAAAQLGTAAKRQFQAELADALRNELVSLRAQRTALENSETPAGAIISPASSPAGPGALTTVLMPVGGGLAGLALGCLLALLLERLTGAVRSARDVEAAGLPVIAAVPPRGWKARLMRRADAEAVDTTVRRLRAAILDLDPRPDVIAIAPAGSGGSDADASEAVAESFAKAGHHVVLVRGDSGSAGVGLGMEDGLAQALLHERLNVMDLLQPSVEPLLSLLPHGHPTAESRELVVADRVRSVLSPLIDAGHLVVIQSPGIDTAEGEAILGAADRGIVVVRVGRTRPREVDQVTTQSRTRGALLTGLVVGPKDRLRRTPQGASSEPAGADGRDDHDSVRPSTSNGTNQSASKELVERDPMTRPPA